MEKNNKAVWICPICADTAAGMIERLDGGGLMKEKCSMCGRNTYCLPYTVKRKKEATDGK